MDIVVNEIRRPVIFVKKLTKTEFNNLTKLSGTSSPKYLTRYSTSFQVYTTVNGCIEIADTLSVNSDKEILCFTYDDFLTRWSEYKLWMILQNTQ